MLTNKKILLTGFAGLAGLMLMFAGDMFLYFTTQPVQNFEKELLSLMKRVSETRLIIGAVLGPLAAVLYCIGFLQIYFAIDEEQKKPRILIYILFCTGMVFGGTFHAHFYVLGMAAKHNLTTFIPQLFSFLQLFIVAYVACMMIGTLLLVYLIIKNKTVYPKWMILLMPMLLNFLVGLWNMLPQPLMIIITGGWFNLMYLPLFILSMRFLKSSLQENLGGGELKA